MKGRPMPHDPGCPGHSHARRGEKPCETYRAAMVVRKQLTTIRHRGDCDACPATDTPVHRHGSWTLCESCYDRWQRDGFTGNGPGPVRWHRAIDRATEHAETITRLSLRMAADKLGVDARTISRWRKLLREMT